MACGRQSLEGYVTYTGMCKHENDPGEEVQCQELEESASCMSAILRKLIEWFLFALTCKHVIMPIFIFQYLPIQFVMGASSFFQKLLVN